MIHVQETNLAWALIDVAKPELDVRERNHVFICVGAGDAFTAIRILVKLIAVKQIPVEPELLQLCVTWLEAYVLHDDFDQLRLLIEGFAGADIHRSHEVPVSLVETKYPAALMISAAPGRRGRWWSNRRAAASAGTRIA